MAGKHDVDLKVGVTGAEQFKRDTEKAGKATTKFGKDTETVGDKASSTAKKVGLLSGAVKALTGWLVGLVSITGLFQFFTKWLDHINKIIAAQQQLVDETKQLNTAAKSFAAQAGQIGVPGGIEASRQQIIQLTERSGLQSFAKAEAITGAAHSAFGTTDQLFDPRQMEIAVAIGKMGQVREKLGAKSFEALAAIALQSKAKTPDEIKAVLQMASVIQQASIKSDPEQFFAAAGKAIPQLIGMGVEPAIATGMYAGILGGGVTPDLGAELLKQLAVISLEIPQLAGLKTQERLLAFKELAKGKSEQELMALGLTSERAIKVSGAFSEVNVQAMDRFIREGRIGGAAQKYDATIGQFPTSPLGQIEAQATKTLVAGATATLESQLGEEARKTAEKQRLQTVDETPFFMKDEAVANALLIGNAMRRIRALKASGVDTSVAEAKIDEIFQAPNRIPPIGLLGVLLNPRGAQLLAPGITAEQITQQEAGELGFILNELEMNNPARGGGTTINSNNVININTDKSKIELEENVPIP